MPAPVRVVGSYLSPYVRKVLVCLHLKGVPYRIDPIVPFYGNDAFTRLSPTRRIPVLLEGEHALVDSSVICQYLEERYPEPRLYPAKLHARARARWLEEYADSCLGEVFIWRLFNERGIKPFVWGIEPDTAAIERALREDVPEVMGYLEGELPAEGFLLGGPGIADISIACFFRNLAFARCEPDPERWPVATGFVRRVLDLEPFAALRPFEESCRRTPMPEWRTALAALGAPLTADTFGTAAPRRALLTVS